MKKLKLLLIAATLLLSITALCVCANAATYSGTCGASGISLMWTLDTSTGVLEIDGTGEMNDWTLSSSAPWYSYRSYIKIVTLDEGVTSIGNSAFNSCASLASVSMPGVTSIGYGAFYDCDSLASVEMPSVTSIGYQAFYYCDSLASVEMPSVKSIGDQAFYSCASLASVEMPTVTSIGYEAFRYCSNLKEATFYSKNVSFGSSVFANTHKDFTIYSYAGSKAETYANKNNHAFVAIECIGEHDYEVRDDLSTPPSCVDDGETVEVCLTCGNRDGTPIPALGHRKLVISEAERYTVENSSSYPFSVSGNQITSTNKADNSSSTYTITALHDFTLELQYKVSSENGYDWLTIKYNSTQVARVSGTSVTSFTDISIPMVEGDTVTITYSKDVSQSSGSDCAWVKILTEPAVVNEVDATEEVIAPFLSCRGPVLCDFCGEELAEALPHDETHHEAQEVTCLEIGWEEYITCSRCDYTTYEEIPALGHDEVVHEAQEVTCLNIGWDNYVTCDRCGYTTYEEIPALGHRNWMDSMSVLPLPEH